MKLKLLAQAALILAFAFSSFGQKSGYALDEKQRMAPFAMGMAISVLGERHDDLHLEALKTIEGQIRYYSSELKPLTGLEPTENPYIRRDVAAKAMKGLQAKSNQSDRWKLLLGDFFGDLYIQMKRAEENPSGFDDHDLRFSLEMIGKLSENPPDDIPKNLVKAFRSLGKTTKMANIASPKNIRELASKVAGILSSLA